MVPKWHQCSVCTAVGSPTNWADARLLVQILFEALTWTIPTEKQTFQTDVKLIKLGYITDLILTTTDTFSFSSVFPKSMKDGLEGTDVGGWTPWDVGSLFSFFDERVFNGVIEAIFNSGSMSSAFRILKQSVGRLSRRPCLLQHSVRDGSGKLKGRLSRRWGSRVGRAGKTPGKSRRGFPVECTGVRGVDKPSDLRFGCGSDDDWDREGW